MTCQWIFHHLYINFLHNRRTFSPFSFPFELFRALPLRLASRYYSWTIFPPRLRFPFRGSTPAVQTLDDGRFSLIWRWTWSTWCQETKERDGRFKNHSSFPRHMYPYRRIASNFSHYGPLFPSLIQSSLPHFNRSLNQATNECATKFSHRDSLHPQRHRNSPAVFRSLLSLRLMLFEVAPTNFDRMIHLLHLM